MLKILSFLLLFSVVAYGQTETEIRQGKTLQYTIYTGGSEVPLTMVLDSVTPAFVKIGWTIEGMGTGKWVMTKNSLDNASRGYWDEPTQDSEQQLADDQNVLLFSKAQLNALKTNKTVSYDGETYSVKPLPADQKFTLGGIEFGTHYLENANGSAKIWVLDNAVFPAIVKFIGNPVGLDVELKSIR